MTKGKVPFLFKTGKMPVLQKTGKVPVLFKTGKVPVLHKGRSILHTYSIVIRSFLHTL